MELDGAGQAGAADVGDAVEAAERLEQLPQHGLELRHAVDERLALEDVEVREAGDARAGVARVRAALEERRRALGPERRAHGPGDDDGAERDVARR